MEHPVSPTIDHSDALQAGWTDHDPASIALGKCYLLLLELAARRRQELTGEEQAENQPQYEDEKYKKPEIADA